MDRSFFINTHKAGPLNDGDVDMSMRPKCNNVHRHGNKDYNDSCYVMVQLNMMKQKNKQQTYAYERLSPSLKSRRMAI